LLGPPGSGKGTQGERLARALGLPEISTGALFRQQMAQRTALGAEAQIHIAQGRLVPDRVTNAMVRDRLAAADAADGFILDGYPRNLPQVAVLDQILSERGWGVDAVLEFRLPEALIVERLLKRADLEARQDDTEPVILRRLAVYRAETEPIARLYAERGALRVIAAEGTVEEVAARVAAALEAAG
jgi:adenylate kinase